MGIIILAKIFFPEYSVPSIMPTTRNCWLRVEVMHAYESRRSESSHGKIAAYDDQAAIGCRWGKCQSTLHGNFYRWLLLAIRRFMCVCVFAAVWLSTYFIKREAAFMCYRFVTNIQCHSTLQTTPGHAPTLLNTHASALVPHPHLVCLL